MLNRTYPAFPRSYGKTSNWTSAPDFGALLIRPILAEQPLGPVRSSQCQPSTRRVFFIEERPTRRQRPEPRGFFLSWKRNPIRTRAPPALASGTFFVPFAHVDRPVRR